MRVLKNGLPAILAMLLIGACGSASTTASSPSATPSAGSTASPSAAATADLPAFKCADQVGNGWPGPGTARTITDVRTGRQSGYDRFVIQFSGTVPGWRVRQKAGSSVTLDPSGQTVTLDGSAALIVTLNPASTNGGYAGSTDQKPAYVVLREARQLGDFEAVDSWGLGLTHAACFRAFTEKDPDRLVIDVQAA